MISYHTGDATLPDIEGPLVIAHICNDAGRFGAGFAKAVATRYPTAQGMYYRWHDGVSRATFKACELGAIQWCPVGRDIGLQAGDRWVVNMVAQHGTRSKTNPKPLDLDALTACLRNLNQSSYVSELNVPIVMPRIGTRLAGGTWDEIEPIIVEQVGYQDVRVYDLPE